MQCAIAGNRGMGANGLNIVMRGSDHTASLDYYTAPYLASSFYDLRPVERAADALGLLGRPAARRLRARSAT